MSVPDRRALLDHDRVPLDGANMHGANLNGANLINAGLSDARWLTQKQLDKACGSSGTRLPWGLTLKPCSNN